MLNLMTRGHSLRSGRAAEFLRYAEVSTAHTFASPRDSRNIFVAKHPKHKG